LNTGAETPGSPPVKCVVQAVHPPEAGEVPQFDLVGGVGPWPKCDARADNGLARWTFRIVFVGDLSTVRGRPRAEYLFLRPAEHTGDCRAESAGTLPVALQDQHEVVVRHPQTPGSGGARDVLKGDRGLECRLALEVCHDGWRHAVSSGECVR